MELQKKYNRVQRVSRKMSSFWINNLDKLESILSSHQVYLDVLNRDNSYYIEIVLNDLPFYYPSKENSQYWLRWHERKICIFKVYKDEQLFTDPYAIWEFNSFASLLTAMGIEVMTATESRLLNIYNNKIVFIKKDDKENNNKIENNYIPYCEEIRRKITSSEIGFEEEEEEEEEVDVHYLPGDIPLARHRKRYKDNSILLEE